MSKKPAATNRTAVTLTETSGKGIADLTLMRRQPLVLGSSFLCDHQRHTGTYSIYSAKLYNSVS